LLPKHERWDFLSCQFGCRQRADDSLSFTNNTSSSSARTCVELFLLTHPLASGRQSLVRSRIAKLRTRLPGFHLPICEYYEYTTLKYTTPTTLYYIYRPLCPVHGRWRSHCNRCIYRDQQFDLISHCNRCIYRDQQFDLMPDSIYYNELGLPASASEAEIKKAYRKAAMKWPPGGATPPPPKRTHLTDRISAQTRMEEAPRQRKSSNRCV